MAGKYDELTHAQLVELLEKRDRTKKLGLNTLCVLSLL